MITDIFAQYQRFILSIFPVLTITHCNVECLFCELMIAKSALLMNYTLPLNKMCRKVFSMCTMQILEQTLSLHHLNAQVSVFFLFLLIVCFSSRHITESVRKQHILKITVKFAQSRENKEDLRYMVFVIMIRVYYFVSID